VSVDIDEIDAALTTPISATFTLSAHNVSTATTVGADIVQRFAGSFSITNGATNLDRLIAKLLLRTLVGYLFEKNIL
jgi:hypothetical protein